MILVFFLFEKDGDCDNRELGTVIIHIGVPIKESHFNVLLKTSDNDFL